MLVLVLAPLALGARGGGIAPVSLRRRPVVAILRLLGLLDGGPGGRVVDGLDRAGRSAAPCAGDRGRRVSADWRCDLGQGHGAAVQAVGRFRASRLRPLVLEGKRRPKGKSCACTPTWARISIPIARARITPAISGRTQPRIGKVRAALTWRACRLIGRCGASCSRSKESGATRTPLQPGWPIWEPVTICWASRSYRVRLNAPREPDRFGRYMVYEFRAKGSSREMAGRNSVPSAQAPSEMPSLPGEQKRKRRAAVRRYLTPAGTFSLSAALASSAGARFASALRLALGRRSQATSQRSLSRCTPTSAINRRSMSGMCPAP